MADYEDNGLPPGLSALVTQRPATTPQREISATDDAAPSRALSALDFSDIVVTTGRSFSHDPRIRGLPGAGVGQKKLPTEVEGDFENLMRAVDSERPEDKRRNYAVIYDDIRYRVQRKTIEGGSEVIFLARGMWPIPTLEQFNIHESIRTQLLTLGADGQENGRPPRSGLVVIFGEMRAGKTTLASSLTRSLVIKSGKNAVTLEDPTELRLQGEYGDAFIYQNEYREEDFEDEFAEMLRSRAGYIFVGEIRSAQIAAAVIRGALNGACLIATSHGGDMAQGLTRIGNMAASVDGDYATAALAECLTAAVSLKLTETPTRRTVSGQALFTDPTSSSCPVRSLLRQSKPHMINAALEQQTSERLAAWRNG